MKINKRIIRNIGHNKSFYISTILLTVFAVSFLIASISTGDTVDRTMNSFLDDNGAEDARFYTALPIDSEKMEDIEEKYDLVMEKQSFIDDESGEKTVRVFSRNEELNRYVVTKGNDVSADDEILITENFAKENGYEIGDDIEIKDRDYKITGYCIQSDYAYMLKTSQEIFINNKDFGLAVVTDKALDRIGDPNSYYAVKYSRDNQDEVRNYLYDEFMVTSYTADYANTRINYTRIQGQNYSSMGILIAPIFFILIMLIIALILGRMVKREQKQIGILTALGYRKKEIVSHYMKFAAIPGIIGGILGIAGGIPFAKGYTFMAFTDFEPVPYEMVYSYGSMAAGLVIPVILYMLTSMFVVRRIMRHSSKEMLKGKIGMDVKNIRRALSRSAVKAKNKLKIRVLLLNPGRTLVACIGLMIASTSLICGFIMRDSCDYIVQKGLDNAGKYEYQYYFTAPRDEDMDDCEKFVSGNFEVKDKDVMFSLSGIEKDSEYLELDTVSGDDIDYGRFYMTTAGASAYGVEEGDDFEFYNPVTMDRKKVKIEGLIDDNTQVVVYTSVENAAEMLDMPEDSYNAVMSDKKLDIPDSRILLERSKDMMKKGMENYLIPVKMVMNILLGIGIAMCFAVAYLTANMIIEENRYNISMMKILGFRKNEVNSMLLNGNHILPFIGFLLSIPLGLSICTAAMADTVESFSVYIESQITMPSVVICLVLTLVAYFASILVLRSKINKVDMITELKEAAE